MVARNKNIENILATKGGAFTSLQDLFITQFCISGVIPEKDTGHVALRTILFYLMESKILGFLATRKPWIDQLALSFFSLVWQLVLTRADETLENPFHGSRLSIRQSSTFSEGYTDRGNSRSRRSIHQLMNCGSLALDAKLKLETDIRVLPKETLAFHNSHSLSSYCVLKADLLPQGRER